VRAEPWCRKYASSVAQRCLKIDAAGNFTTVYTFTNSAMEQVPAVGPARQAIPVPARAGEPSTVEYVVFIIKENRTSDQVFGDIEKGNGDKSLVMFGRNVTPNQHRLAEEFVLLDNFYATGASRDVLVGPFGRRHGRASNLRGTIPASVSFGQHRGKQCEGRSHHAARRRGGSQLETVRCGLDAGRSLPGAAIPSSICAGLRAATVRVERRLDGSLVPLGVRGMAGLRPRPDCSPRGHLLRQGGQSLHRGPDQ